MSAYAGQAAGTAGTSTTTQATGAANQTMTLVGCVGGGANATDPFMNYLLAMTYEKKGDAARARELYQKAYDLATAHNPPAAFVRPNARKKLGAP